MPLYQNADMSLEHIDSTSTLTSMSITCQGSLAGEHK